MPAPIHIDDIDRELLLTLWQDDELTTAEVARELGVGHDWLVRNRERLGLGERATRRPKPMVDPTPEEIAAGCAEARARRTLIVNDEPADECRSLPCYSWNGQSFSVRYA